MTTREERLDQVVARIHIIVWNLGEMLPVRMGVTFPTIGLVPPMSLLMLFLGVPFKTLLIIDLIVVLMGVLPWFKKTKAVGIKLLTFYRTSAFKLGSDPVGFVLVLFVCGIWWANFLPIEGSAWIRVVLIAYFGPRMFYSVDMMLRGQNPVWLARWNAATKFAARWPDKHYELDTSSGLTLTQYRGVEPLAKLAGRTPGVHPRTGTAASLASWPVVPYWITVADTKEWKELEEKLIDRFSLLYRRAVVSIDLEPGGKQDRHRVMWVTFRKLPIFGFGDIKLKASGGKALTHEEVLAKAKAKQTERLQKEQEEGGEPDA